MLETLKHFDQDFFRTINSGMNSSFLDWLMTNWRNPPTWIPLYAFMLFVLFRQYREKAVVIALFAGLAVGLSDQLSASVVKPIVERLRPCADPSFSDQVRLLLTHCGAGFSFYSAHASNHFTIAVFFLSAIHHSKRWIAVLIYSWAAVVCFAQVYVGVHYPLDVITGACAGILIGMLSWWTCKKAMRKIFGD